MKTPAVTRIRCLTETKQLIDNPINVLQQHTNQLGPTFTYYFGGAQKVLVSSDPDIIRHILKDNHQNYHKSPIQTRHMVNYLGRGLLSDPWREWRPKRKKMQKGFQVTNLDTQAVLMHEAIQECQPDFEQAFKTGPADLAPLICRFIFSMTARALFDIRMSPDEIRHISQTVSTVQAFMVRQVFQPYLNPWFHLSGQVSRHQALRRCGDDLLLRHIEGQLQRPVTDNERHTLLDILFAMEAVQKPGFDSAQPSGSTTTPHLEQNRRAEMTLQQVLAEAMQMLVAGHETSSNALGWTITLLDQHPHYQASMREEFDQVPGTRPVSFSDLRQLPKTQAILDESMRLYPPFWMLDRIALANDSINGINIRRGESVMCFLYGLHRSKLAWDDPDTFRPERFLIQSASQHPVKGIYHLPFGNGPRRCIGEQLSRLQMILLLQMLYQNYEITLSNPKIELEPHFTLSRKGGLMAQVRPL